MSRSNDRLGIVAAVLLLLSACGGGGSGSGSGGGGSGGTPNVSLAVSPSSIQLGSKAQLTWTSSNVSSCTASGSWQGTQATSGSQTVTPTSPGSLLYTLTCNGSQGSAVSNAALTVLAAAEKQTMTLTGFVGVAGSPSQPLSSTTVAVSVSGNTQVTTTDASGNYSVTVSTTDPSAVVTAVATGGSTTNGGSMQSTPGAHLRSAQSAESAVPVLSTNGSAHGRAGAGSFEADHLSHWAIRRGVPRHLKQESSASMAARETLRPHATSGGSIKLSSILGSFSDLLAKSDGSGNVGSAQNIRNNITQLSTAEAVLAAQANQGVTPTNATQLAAALNSINTTQELNIAGTLKLIIQNPSYPLPTGVSDTLSFAQTPSIRDPYIANVQSTDQGSQDLQTAIDQTVSDPAAVASPSPQTVPSSLILSQPVASNPGGWGNYGELAYAYTFASDGTGTRTDDLASTTTHWSVSGTHIVVTLDTPQTSTYQTSTTTNDPNPDVTTYTDNLTTADLVQTGARAYAETDTFQETQSHSNGDPTTTSSYSTQSNLIWLVLGDNLKGIPASALAGTAKALPIYRPEMVAGDGPDNFQGDLLSFTSSSAGTAKYENLSFQYANAADGALQVTLSNGTVLKYYTTADLNADAGYVFVDVVTGSLHFCDVRLGFNATQDLHFSDASVPNTYYQYGYGDESPDDANLNASTSGFALRFLSDHTVANDESSINADGQGDPGPGQNTPIYDWSINANTGSLFEQQYYDSSTGQFHCNPSTSSTCLLYIEREIIPMGVSADGRYDYWIEHRRYGDGPSGEITSTTPDEYLNRYYEVQGPNMLNGTWEFVLDGSTGTVVTSHPDVISFFANGAIYAAIHDADPNCTNNGNGMQSGTFNWVPTANSQNIVSGTITVSLSVDQVGTECGIGHAGSGGSVLTINGLGQFTAGQSGDGFGRVPSQQGQIVGSFIAGLTSSRPLVPSANPAIFTFFPDGYFVDVTDSRNDPDCPQPGAEFGQYVLQTVTGPDQTTQQMITLQNLTVDTSTCGGVDLGKSSGTLSNVQISDTQLSVTAEDGNVVTLEKMSAP